MDPFSPQRTHSRASNSSMYANLEHVASPSIDQSRSTNPLGHDVHAPSMSPSHLSMAHDHHQPSYGMPPHLPVYHANPYAAFGNAPQLGMPPVNPRKRRFSEDGPQHGMPMVMPGHPGGPPPMYGKQESPMLRHFDMDSHMPPPPPTQQPPQHLGQPPAKKSRVNTPWTPAEEQRLKGLREEGLSWNEIAKRTEGSVKKHWYKVSKSQYPTNRQDMHYADFAQDEQTALLNAIRDYEAKKWKVIGEKVGKPAKACEQYAKEHFTKEQIAGKAKDKDPSIGHEGSTASVESSVLL